MKTKHINQNIRRITILECKQAQLNNELKFTAKYSVSYELMKIEYELISDEIERLNKSLRKVSFK